MPFPNQRDTTRASFRKAHYIWCLNAIEEISRGLVWVILNNHSTTLRYGSFFGRNIKTEYLYCSDKNYYYLCKSNISVIYSVYVREIWSVFQKNEFVKKPDKQQELFLPNTDNFSVFFIIFESGRIFESTVDKWEVKCKLQSCYWKN